MKNSTKLELKFLNYEICKKDLNAFLALKVPVIIYGEIGKTYLAESVLQNLIVIDSREIMDLRSLTGFYAIDKGTIRYVDGILVDAMKVGRSIMFKRIDYNQNLLYFLYSVIKYRKVVSYDGKEIVAHKDFNILFSSKFQIEVKDVCFVGPIYYKFSDMFKLEGPLKDILYKFFESFNSHKKCLYDEGSECRMSCPIRSNNCFDGDNGFCFLLDGPMCSYHSRIFIQLKQRFINIKKLNYKDRLNIYENLCNLFLKHDSENLLQILNLNIFPDLILYDISIAQTYAYSWGLRNLIINVKNRKYSLLVGETGSGKTAVVQYLSSYSKKYFGYETSLKVVNMSSDFDGEDLIGGYCSLDISKRIDDLYKKCKISKPKILDNVILLAHLRSTLSKMDVSAFKSQIADNFESFEKIYDDITFLEDCIEKKTRFIYKEGILTKAMTNGNWILLDEINLCDENTLNLIEAVVSKQKLMNFESNNQQETEIHPNFMLFACMNPHGDFGKKKFDTEQFNIINFYDFSLSFDDTKTIVAKVIDDKLLSEDVENIAKFYCSLKHMIRKKELVNKIEPLLTGRTLLRSLKSLMCHDKYSMFDIFNIFFLTQFNMQSRVLASNILKDICEVKNKPIEKTHVDMNYILTPNVQILLYDIDIAVKLNYPVLLQGDTSTGKTSLVMYLAKKFNKKVLRINNHEHTEAMDYLGSYVSTPNGIEFKEGAFLNSIRKGDWVVLDELNLAPSDVLEVLNRLLDDNREIYVPQIDEVIKPHSEFRLFATQNIEYGGRKGLSKAFRNRFIEIFFEEKTENEILEIIHLKTKLPKSFCSKMTSVYSLLKNQRSISCLVTLRDLFRWANRSPTSLYEVFETGLSIIYERQRTSEDKKLVYETFCEVFKGYCDNFNGTYKENSSFNIDENIFVNFKNEIIITPSIEKLIRLIYAALLQKEPVLLVGETGIGKTKICDIVSKVFGNKLVTLNMHNGTESSDFLGSYVMSDSVISWKDGLLVESMKRGDAFLIDEINLAEDSVLERLNSLFEHKREIFVTETEENVVAHGRFKIFATMNPGNDFGKRELSPALRNRFTEIYFELSPEEIRTIFLTLLDKSLNLSSKSRSLLFNCGQQRSSIRQFEVFLEFIKNVKLSKNQDYLINVENDLSEDDLIIEGMNLGLFPKKEIVNVIEEDDRLGIYPYFIFTSEKTSFSFTNSTTKVNFKRILRACLLNKGVMLEGDPGVGKTSIICTLGKLCKKKVIRINLSEQTELSDLVGTYIPVNGGIEFVPSELTIGLREGMWIILDEINLCTQSVIEGFNSILDYRRTLFLPELLVKVHPETKIFATLNPYNSKNGRKALPKSFLDRFIKIKMDNYTYEDITSILGKLFCSYRLLKDCSLRENIIYNTLKLNEDNENIEYEINNNKVQFGDFHISCNKMVNSKFVVVHSQIKQIETIFKCIEHKIPMIVVGKHSKNSIIRFVGDVMDKAIYDFICHRDIDTSDLLGQYHKIEGGSFGWKDSPFIESVKQGKFIVIHNPELVEKSIFDRLNSVLESERFINIYEKGIDTNVKVHENTRFILFSDNPEGLSPALVDRCMVIEVSDKFSYIDLWKIFIYNKEMLFKLESSFKEYENSDNNTFAEMNKKIKFSGKGNNFLEKVDIRDWEYNGLIEVSKLKLRLKEFYLKNSKPYFFERVIKGTYNTLLEEDIGKMFSYQKSEITFDQNKLNTIKFYESIIFNVPIKNDDISRIKSFKEDAESATINFVKNAGLEILKKFNKNGDGCVLNFPRSMRDLKIKALNACNEKCLSEYNKIKECFELLSEIKLDLYFEFDETYFDLLMKDQCDPLRTYKEYLQYRKEVEEAEILQKCYLTIKNIYKYGRGNIKRNLEDYDSLIRVYNSKIKIIDKKLNRNFDLFKSKLVNLDFCGYVLNDGLKEFFEEFDDIFNYYLIFLFKSWCGGKGCYGSCRNINNSMIKGKELDRQEWGLFLSSSKASYQSLKVITRPEKADYEVLLANFLKNGPKFLSILSELEYKNFGQFLCKFIHNLSLNMREIDIKNLVFEAAITDNIYFEHNLIDTTLEIDERLLDECLRNIFKVKEIGYTIDHRVSSINIGSNVINKIHEIEEINRLPICVTPDILLFNLKSKIKSEEHPINKEILEAFNELDINILDSKSNVILNEAIFLLEKYFKKSDSISWIKNYKYSLYLNIHGLTPESAEQYFLDSLVYEFIDRMYFAEHQAINRNDNVFYNVVLQYKAFDIEGITDKKLKDGKAKLRKDQSLFVKIHEDLRNFLTLPVTNIINLSFEKPDCVCDRAVNHIFDIFVTSTDEKCQCKAFFELTESFKRKQIEDILRSRKELSKKVIIDKFYNRVPAVKFSYEEICLAKVIKKMTDDATHLKLVDLAIDHPFPPFLYFVFTFSEDQENIEYEDGTGIKSGTGEKNISDKIEHEDEISNEHDADHNNVEEDDGISFENDGSISTVDEDDIDKNEDFESGVEEDRSEESMSEDQSMGDDEKNEEEDELDLSLNEEGLGEENSEENDNNMYVEDDETVSENGENNEKKDIEDADEQDLKNTEIVNEYKYKEGKLNQNQTCAEAEDYERKVFGENQEEEALCPGDGEEKVQGTDKLGEEIPMEHALNIKRRNSDSPRLTILLRSIFESNKYNKYKGDYKTGKKLNMKRIIPYIASDYRRDKIWMKRRRSDKKDYIVRIFIDNSRSMYSQQMIDTLLTVYSRISNSFKMLGIPVELYKFGDKLKRIEIRNINFTDTETNIEWIDEFKDGINIILTDGIFQKTGFYNNNFLVILIDKCDIKKMSKVTLADNNIFVQKYLDIFSLKYCVIIDVEELESTFILALSELIKTVILE